MRKCPILCLLLPVLVSCYERVEIPTGEDTPVLVMNAQMRTNEDFHHVYLHQAYRGTTEQVHDALIRIYRNGQFYEEGWESLFKEYYVFDAPFSAGDEIRIEASKGSQTVSATVIVPPEPPVFTLDTLTVRRPAEQGDYLQVRMHFKDPAGDSWYRVEIEGEMASELHEPDGSPRTGYKEILSWSFYLLPGSDPVLGGSAVPDELDLGSFLTPENNFSTFSDEAFAGKDYTLRLLTYTGYFQPEWWFGPSEGASGCYLETNLKVFARLISTDFSQYRYLKALDNLETFGYETSFLVEPTTLPSNVEGGLGFVTIDNVREVLLDERDAVYPYDPYEEMEED